MSLLRSLPEPPADKTGWPWTEETNCLLFDKNKQYPKVSIVMPTYNQGKYIEEAIRSLLLQNYPNLEFIIMDGGSTDDTVFIIKKYQPWITYWRTGKDGGQSHAINMGLEKSTGDWFNWLNSDDYLLPEALLSLSKVIMESPDPIVTVCGKPKVMPVKGGVRELPENKKDLFYEDFIALGYYQVTALYATDQVRRFGGVDEQLHFGMDLKLVMQMNFAGATTRIDKHIIVMRSHAESKGIAQASEFYRDWVAAYSSSLNYFPREFYNQKLFDKIHEVTGIDFTYSPDEYKPRRFSEKEYKHAQLYMGERIINLMYIYNQKGLGEMVGFYKKNYPEYYNNTNIAFIRFKDYPIVRMLIKLKKLIFR